MRKKLISGGSITKERFWNVVHGPRYERHQKRLSPWLRRRTAMRVFIPKVSFLQNVARDQGGRQTGYAARHCAGKPAGDGDNQHGIFSKKSCPTGLVREVLSKELLCPRRPKKTGATNGSRVQSILKIRLHGLVAFAEKGRNVEIGLLEVGNHGLAHGAVPHGIKSQHRRRRLRP